jgi:hypothetical protein
MRSSAEIRPICSDDEFHKYKRMIRQSMGSLLLDVAHGRRFVP